MSARGSEVMASVAVVARVALLRLARGRATWLLGVFIALPLPFAVWLRGRGYSLLSVFEIVRLLVAIVPGWLVAAAVGDELDHAAYVWARPLARWTVVVGKLVALVPIAVALVCSSWIATACVTTGEPPPLHSVAALAACTAALCCVGSGIATLAPRFAMPLTIVYALFDLGIGELPISLALASITHQATFEGFGAAGSDAWMGVAIVGVPLAWLALALVVVRNREA
jgi:hypothetical protein